MTEPVRLVLNACHTIVNIPNKNKLCILPTIQNLILSFVQPIQNKHVNIVIWHRFSCRDVLPTLSTGYLHENCDRFTIIFTKRSRSITYISVKHQILNSEHSKELVHNALLISIELNWWCVLWIRDVFILDILVEQKWTYPFHSFYLQMFLVQWWQEIVGNDAFLI